MKIFNTLSLVAIVTSLTFVASSCNNFDSGDYTVDQTLPGCINIITNIESGQTSIETNVGYTMKYNYTLSTVDVYIESLKLPDGNQYSQLQFSNLPFTYKDNGWKVIYQNNVTPQSLSGLIGVPTFTTLSMNVLDRYVMYTYYPAIKINYLIGNYSIVSTPTTLAFSGLTTVTPGQGTDYSTTTQETIYSFNFDMDKSTAVMRITGATYSPTMTSTFIELRDLPFSVSSKGDFVIHFSEKINPYMGTDINSIAINEQCWVSDFTCIADAANNLQMSFVYNYYGSSNEDLITSYVNVSSTDGNQ